MGGLAQAFSPIFFYKHMIDINEAYIKANGKEAIVDVSISYDDKYAGLMITSITADNDTTYRSSGPSDKPIFSKNRDAISIPDELTEEDAFILEAKLKRMSVVIPLDNFSGLLYVYIHIGGIPSPNAQCGDDASYKRIVMYNEFIMAAEEKELARKYAKAIGSDNETDARRDYVRHILEEKSLNCFIQAGDFDTARMILKKKKESKEQKKCCTDNGR